MRKTVLSLLFSMLLCTALCVSAWAADRDYVVDGLGVLTEEESNTLNAEAERIADTYHVNPCFILADNYMDYGFDSISGLLENYYADKFGSADGLIMGVDFTASVWSAHCAGNAFFDDHELDLLWDAYANAQTYYQGIADYLTAVESNLDVNGESGSALINNGVFAPHGSVPRLADNADLLSDLEEAALLAKLDEISERQQFDVVVVTTDNLGGYYYVNYADDYFDYNGFGFGKDFDGALLLISMEPGNRNCYISTSGYGLTALDDNTIDWMLDDIVDGHLANGEYNEAMNRFADMCDYFVAQAKDGHSGELPRVPFSSALSSALALGLLLGLVVAAIRILILRQSMKSVRKQHGAGNYVRAGSLNLTASSDLYLYSTVSRSKREQSSSGGSSSHSSSSGRSHGGGGRSF